MVVGRFQPLHLGHVRMLEFVASRFDYLVVGVGSSNRAGLLDNPFSFEERLKMIERSLKLGVGYEVVGIPDFDDDDKWVNWIKKNIVFDVYCGNTEHELGLFRKAGFKVKEVPFFNRDVYSATEVRKRIIEGGDWRSIVPEGAAGVLLECGGVERIKSLNR
jgi:nicotinamide-nucleotide adenylyltransferase